MEYFDYITRIFSFGAMGWGDELLKGILITIALAICSFSLGCIFGLFLALGKLSKVYILKKFSTVYVYVLRGTPELLVIYLFFFGSSTFLMSIASIFGYGGYIEIPPFLAGMLAIALISGSYSAEVFRGAITSIHRGQKEAGLALGLNEKETFDIVLLPQALRVAIPGLGNIWQLTLKDTSLVSIIGLAEVMNIARLASSTEREPLIFYIFVSIIFLFLAHFSSKLQNKIEFFYNKGNS